MLYYNEGSVNNCIDEVNLENILRGAVGRISDNKTINRILIIPPDFTRFHSRAGVITEILYSILGDKVKMILPALGTHHPMSTEQKTEMFKGVPLEVFKDHDHKNDVMEIGRIGSEEMLEISRGAVDFDWPVQVNRTLVEDDWDLIISIGQVVPHEVVGMSNYTKNTLVGTGGKECIDKSHFVGALCGLEKIMGKVSTPVRELLNRGSDRYMSNLPIIYIHTVVTPDWNGGTELKGLFIGDDEECFTNAAQLAQRANIFLLKRQPLKIVVYLDPDEYQSAWVGSKAIYRSRMAIADGGEVVILAPGIYCFGENPDADRLIRKFGYKGTPYISGCVKEDSELAANLGTAAHLIHGSTEGRFNVTLCAGSLGKDEIESVGHTYGSLEDYSKKYDINSIKDGWNVVDGEEIFYISNPGLGLWAFADIFNS